MKLGVFDSPLLVSYKSYTPSSHIDTPAHSTLSPLVFFQFCCSFIYLFVCKFINLLAIVIDKKIYIFTKIPAILGQLAREAAQQDIVLLENRNNILPLPLSSGKLRVAVIGPNANNPNNLLGDYAPIPSYIITPLQAVTEIVPSPNQNVLYSPGCYDVFCANQTLFSEAIQAAKQADVALLFMGTNTDIEAEGTYNIIII